MVLSMNDTGIPDARITSLLCGCRLAAGSIGVAHRPAAVLAALA